MTDKPKTKTDPLCYVVHSDDWETVLIFTQKVAAMEHALSQGLKYLPSAYGVDVRAKPQAKTTTSGITNVTTGPITS